MKEELLKIFSVKLRTLFSGLSFDYEKLQEIRLRVNAPLLVCYDNKEFFVNQKNGLTTQETGAFMITGAELKETMEYISNYSLYAFEEEVRQGFLTVAGGHRIGIAGKVIMEEGRIKSMKHISFIHIRLAHQKKGCANHVLPFVLNQEELAHTLIISPPGCGKTTLLRDMIRQLSNGVVFCGKRYEGMQVAVVDERSEIGACYMGRPQNDLGIRTDVLDCCPKAQGMMLMIRSMTPQVIAVDEIGLAEDVEAIHYAANCGCRLLATVHGRNMDEVKGKPFLGDLVKYKLFERYIILSNRDYVGRVEEIFDERGSLLYSDKT